MLLDLKNSTRGKRSLETGVHLFFVVMAVVGCILNINSLSKRKESAIAENVEIFKAKYVKAIEKAEEDLKFCNGQIPLPEILKTACTRIIEEIGFKSYSLVFAAASKLEEKEEKKDEKEKTYPMLELIEKMVKSKVKNPFLFGFKDIGLEITSFLDETFKRKNLGDMFRESQAVRLELGNFLKGTLPEYKYTEVFSVFYFLILDTYSDIDVSEYIKEGRDIEMDIEEYVISACYLGEIVIRILGSPRRAFEFLPPGISISEKTFEESKVRRTLNKGKGSVKF